MRLDLAVPETVGHGWATSSQGLLDQVGAHVQGPVLMT